MTPPNGPSDPNAPYGQHDPNAPTEQFPPYTPYPPYPPTSAGAPPEQTYGQSPYGQSPYGQSPYGPPPYNQPYGAPPMYPAYPGYPPPMPPKSSNRTLWIVLGVVGGVLLLACISCVVLGVVLSKNLANSPIFGSTFTATEFCSDEQQQNYTSAYDLFSPNLQSQMTQDEFASRAQELDTEDGTISTCDAVPDSSQVADTSATFQVTVTRGTGSAATSTSGAITLINSNGSWQIDSVDQSLGLM